jgi:hypothetical protein
MRGNMPRKVNAFENDVDRYEDHLLQKADRNTRRSEWAEAMAALFFACAAKFTPDNNWLLLAIPMAASTFINVLSNLELHAYVRSRTKEQRGR